MIVKTVVEQDKIIFYNDGNRDQDLTLCLSRSGDIIIEIDGMQGSMKLDQLQLNSLINHISNNNNNNQGVLFEVPELNQLRFLTTVSLASGFGY